MLRRGSRLRAGVGASVILHGMLCMRFFMSVSVRSMRYWAVHTVVANPDDPCNDRMAGQSEGTIMVLLI